LGYSKNEAEFICSSDRTISELLGNWNAFVNADWTRQLEIPEIISQQVQELLAA